MAVKIVLDEQTRYKITADKYNVVLDRAYWSKKNDEWLYGTNKTYHANFGEAVRRMVQKACGIQAAGDHETVVTMKDLALKIEQYTAKVTEMFESLPEEILGNIPHKFYLDEEESAS